MLCCGVQTKPHRRQLGEIRMNKFEFLAWGLLISFYTAAICGAVVLWWLARKELDEKGASHESN